MLARPPGWVADFVGIPFRDHGRMDDGVDCWGLVHLVFRRRFRIHLPDHTELYQATDQVDMIACAIAAHRETWRRVSGPFLLDGDVALLRVSGRAAHVGVICGFPWFLHAEAGIGAACDRLDGLRWGRRVDSIWRHPRMLTGGDAL